MPDFTTKALLDRVIIKADLPVNRSTAAFFIPDTVNENIDRGIIMSIGPGIKDDPTEAKVGDRVIFDVNATEKLTIDGVDYLLMREEDLIAIL